MTVRSDTRKRHLLIVGGGLTGLSAGCYAQRSGYRVTIVEHNLALGGVCTAWQRGPYTIDGCIHWLTGGPFDAVYRELGIFPRVAVRSLDTWMVYRDVRSGLELSVTPDLDALVRRLSDISPEDFAELEKMRDGARQIADFEPSMRPPQLASWRESLKEIWEARGSFATLAHFRGSLQSWTDAKLESPVLRRVFTHLLPEAAPALFLLMVLGYLERGWLSRPVGGTAAFREALEASYRASGGQALLHSTVDEVLVEGGHVTGVRLSDGSEIAADVVVSTSSVPETVLRLLGGGHDAGPTRKRLETWELIGPIVLLSFGLNASYEGQPGLLTLDGIEPLDTGGRRVDSLYLRICNDDPSYAPPGHTVLQAMLPTDYDWWATRGTQYQLEKDRLVERLTGVLSSCFAGFADQVRLCDVATPLTYWRSTRSWRGAFEGWMPKDASLFARVEKTLSGLRGMYMAGQWVEPGGGVPTTVLSGRHVVQLICADDGRPFVAV